MVSKKNWIRAIGLSFLRDQNIKKRREEQKREEEEEEEKKKRREEKVPGRRVDRAFLGRLASGPFSFGALGFGQLARGAGLGPKVPTMPPVFLPGRKTIPGRKKEQG